MTAVSVPHHAVAVLGISNETLGRALVLSVVALIMVGGLAVRFLKARQLYGGSDTPPPDQQTNCSDCGARFPEEEEECPHCGEPVEKSDADTGWGSREPSAESQ